MNLQTHMAGQFSGQVSNQAGTSLPGMPQQQNMMQSSEVPHTTLNMEPGVGKARQFIQDRIYEFLMQRQQTREISPKNMLDIVRRLEEGLFKTAITKEEYLNLETLENRLHGLIRRFPLTNRNQQYRQQGNASVAMGAMIPTPGVPQMVPSFMDNSIISNNMVTSAVNTGSYLLNTTGPSRGMHSGSYGPSDGISYDENAGKKPTNN